MTASRDAITHHMNEKDSFLPFSRENHQVTDTTRNEQRWTSIDKAAIETIREWMTQGTVRRTMKDCAQVLQCSYPRVRAQFRYLYSPLTLGDFMKLCAYFEKDPTEAWLEVLHRAYLMDGDDAKAAKTGRRKATIKALAAALSAVDLPSQE